MPSSEGIQPLEAPAGTTPGMSRKEDRSSWVKSMSMGAKSASVRDWADGLCVNEDGV